MHFLHDVILVTSQLPISARRAKNAYRRCNIKLLSVKNRNFSGETKTSLFLKQNIRNDMLKWKQITLESFMIFWATFDDIECDKRPDGHTTFCFWVLVINSHLRLFNFVKCKHVSVYCNKQTFKKKTQSSTAMLCVVSEDQLIHKLARIFIPISKFIESN
jgi:hypothetical protein